MPNNTATEKTGSAEHRDNTIARGCHDGSIPTSLTIGRALQPMEYPVDLARHDKIVLVQPFDLLGAQRNGCVTPAEADIGWCPSVSANSPTSRTKLSASRKLLKRKVRSIRWPSSCNSQFGVCDRKCSASASVSGGRSPRQGVHFFSASASVMCLLLRHSVEAKGDAADVSIALFLLMTGNLRTFSSSMCRTALARSSSSRQQWISAVITSRAVALSASKLSCANPLQTMSRSVTIPTK